MLLSVLFTALLEPVYNSQSIKICIKHMLFQFGQRTKMEEGLWIQITI